MFLNADIIQKIPIFQGIDDKLSIFGNSCIGSNTGIDITSRATFGHKNMSNGNLAIYQLDSGKTILNSGVDDGIDVDIGDWC